MAAPMLCTAREAAERLNLSIEDVRALVRAGVLLGRRPGGSGLYRIQIKSLEEFQRRGRAR